jgi:hypothetical protein
MARAISAIAVMVGTRMNECTTDAGSNAGARRRAAIHTGADASESRSRCSGGYV